MSESTTGAALAWQELRLRFERLERDVSSLEVRVARDAAAEETIKT